MINFVAFYNPDLPGSIPYILQFTLNTSALTIPDMNIPLDISDTYEFLSIITSERRQAYQIMHLTTDLTLPILYALFLFALMTRSLIRSQFSITLRKWVRFLPFLALAPAGLDLSENIILLYITKHFPESFYRLMGALRFLTLGKFLFLFFNLSLIVYFGIKYRIKREQQDLESSNCVQQYINKLIQAGF